MSSHTQGEPTRTGEPVAVTERSHPAQFTDSIIDALADELAPLAGRGFTIHDPFGGAGVRLGALCDRLGLAFSGTDLELWRDGDPRVALGDSTDPATYPSGPFVVVTSPTYNNGVNDHFKPSDTSKRLTYRVAAGRELHPNNTGRYSGRGSKKGEVEYWRLTREVVKHWPDLAYVNVKDSIRAGEVYPLVGLWVDLLSEHGYAVSDMEVACPGWRFGANEKARLDNEHILRAVRWSPPPCNCLFPTLGHLPGCPKNPHATARTSPYPSDESPGNEPR